MDNSTVNIIRSDGCYLDLSYYNKRDYSIVTASGDVESQPTINILDYVVVSTKDGEKFGELSTIGSFKYNDKSDVTGTEWVTLDYKDFKKTSNTFEFNDIFVDSWDFHLKNKDLTETLFQEFRSNNNDYIACLMGGFNENKLIIAMYEKDEYSSDLTINDTDRYSKVKFSSSLTNDWGETIGETTDVKDVDIQASGGGAPPVDTITENLFKTYYINTKVINDIKVLGTIPTEIIINTYSFPLLIPDAELVDSSIKTGDILTPINAKTFKKNIVNIELFKFNVPEIADVVDVQIRIPFNNNISLNYEDIQGKEIVGTLSYEVITNTTTLFISNGIQIIYKNIFSLGIKVPFKPTGYLSGYSEPNTRLSIEPPVLMIKGRLEIEKTNYLKGLIKEPIKDILKDELVILNDLLKKGVYVNE